MASPQRENGFTPIAHEILEAMQMYKFTLNETKVIMCVWRFTYGFNRKSHELSLTFFMNHTGLSRTRINDSLKNLIECDVLLKTQQGSAKQTNSYSFNKNYEEWKIEKYSSFKDTSNEINTSEQFETSVQNDTSTSVQNGTRTSVQNDTQERNTKENIKKNAYSSQFEEWWKEYPKKVEKKKAFSSFKTALKNNSFDLLLEGLRGYVQHVKKENTPDRFIKHPTTFLNGESFKDFLPKQPDQQKTNLTDHDRQVIAKVKRIDELTDLMGLTDDMDEFEELEKERNRLKSELSMVG